MAECRCGRRFKFDGCVFCHTCQPYRPRVAGARVMRSDAPSGAKLEPGVKMSQAYMDSITKRRYKKSDKAIEEDKARKKRF